MFRIFRSLAPFLLTTLLVSCSTMDALKFWDEDYEFKNETVKLAELRRALVCDTPTEASRMHIFDNAEALLASPLAANLQAQSMSLRSDASFAVIEQGQRRTGGYSLELRRKAEVDEAGTLTLKADWIEPAPDRMQIQILTSLCVLVELPQQPYERAQLLDATGNPRAVWARNPE